jgi:hypothetical protein
MIVNWNRKRGLKKVGLVGLKVEARVWKLLAHSPNWDRKRWPIVKRQDYLAWSIIIVTTIYGVLESEARDGHV